MREEMSRPIYDTLMKYSNEAGYPWHMPGHKRQRGCRMEQPWHEICAMDFTEIPGLDEYHCPEGIIRAAQQQAADIYGVKSSYFLLNGSTVGILAAMSAVCSRCGRVLVARNCHRAVYNAMELMELNPVYVQPEWLPDWDIYGAVPPAQVEQQLRKHQDIQAVIITSPTYEGVISDIRGVADVVHRYGALLIVDEAHGAHLPFFKEWPDSAVSCGADLVIQSLHKTLPAMTQTAILQRCSDLVDEERLFHYVSLYQSTSPSYVMLASMDYAVHFMARETECMEAYVKALHAFRQRMGRLSCIRLLDWKHMTGSCAKGYDDAKLVLSVKRRFHDGITGAWLSQQLLQRGHQPEMTGCSYSLCMSTVMDTAEAFDGLAKALEEIDVMLQAAGQQYKAEKKETAYSAQDFNDKDKKDILTEHEITVYVPSDDNIIRSIAAALAEKKEWLPMNRCRGLVAADYVYAYPPGSPLLVPGERVTEEVLSLIAFDIQAGLNMKGIRDGALCVLCEENR